MLDTQLLNEERHLSFADSFVAITDDGISDHAPILC